MAKECTYIGCKNDRFSQGLCKYHQYLRGDDKWLYQKKKYVEMRNKKHDISKRFAKYPVTYAAIPKQSVKGINKTRIIQAIKQSLIKKNGNTCFFTGQIIGRLDLFHIFPMGKYPQYATDKWNMVLSTRSMNRTWDQGVYEEIMSMPNIEKLFEIIKRKDADPDKKHTGSFYEIIMNRKDK